MSERIIYADRPFRDEFIEEIHTIAPGYIFKTELQPEDLQNVEISLGWNSDYQEKLLASSTLKWVQSISAGVDQLPLETFSKKHILLSNGSGIHSESITEHVLGIILGYSRGLFQAQKAQSDMKWLGSSVHYQSIQGKNTNHWNWPYWKNDCKKMQSIRHELLWNQYIRSSSRRNGKDFFFKSNKGSSS